MKAASFVLISVAIFLWFVAFCAQAGEDKADPGARKTLEGSVILYGVGAFIAIVAEFMKALS